MRLAAAAAILLTVSCYSVDTPKPPETDTTKPPETLKHRVLAEGPHAAGETRQVMYAATSTAYRNLWSSLIGAGDPPPVDFSKEGVLFLTAGQKNTGGYGIAVQSIRREGNAIAVDAAVTTPAPDAMVTQALTTPYLVLAVPKTEATSARWEKE